MNESFVDWRFYEMKTGMFEEEFHRTFPDEVMMELMLNERMYDDQHMISTDVYNIDNSVE